jgi:PEP-CTERM motif
MKKLILLMCVLLGTSAIALANSCPTTTYDNYLGSGFSCTIDDKTFSNFTYIGTASGGAQPVPPGSVEVVPLTTPHNPGFLFGTGWGAASNQTQDSSFDYTVTVNPGGAPITDLTLLMLGSAFTGTGSASIAETACLGDTLADGCLHGTIVNLSTFDDASLVKLSDHLTFPGVDEVDLLKDVQVFGGPNGTAVISGAENQFSEVPEPGTLGMLGLGVISVAGLVRRKLNL